MGTRSIYHGDHSIVAKGGTLTLEGDNIAIVGTPSFSNATLTETTITTLNTSNIDANGSALILDGSSYGVTITTTSGDINLATNLGGGDINITTRFSGSVYLTSDYDFDVEAARRVQITADGAATLRGDGGNGYFQVNTSGIYMVNSPQSGGDCMILPDTELLVRNSNSTVGSVSQVATIQNLWDDSQADGLAVVLEPSALSSTNVFVRFSRDGDVGTTAGRIRGPASGTAIAFQADGADAGGAVNSTGDVVYASGNSDFGEWIEVGDIEEWNLSQEHLDSITPENPSIGLPEGWVCYVREQKFFKEGPGTPMLVTRSALLVGNELGRDSYYGEVFSFSGQISVIVKGRVNSGDLLIPSGSHYCVGISPDNVTFEQYKKVIGTAWTNSSEEKEFGRVIAAIGVKNTF